MNAPYVDAVDLLDARADGGAEHHEIERGRDHRRENAPERRAPGARHLELVDRKNRAPVHLRSTSPTKISSSEDCSVCRSRKRIFAALRSDKQRGDAGALALGVVGIDQLGAVIHQREPVFREVRRDRVDRLLQLDRQLLLAELAHQFGLVLDQHDLAFRDHADAVGHVFGFLDVMRGQDDGDAGGAQIAHHLPHVLAQRDVDAGGRLVQEQNARLVRQRLRDHDAALHAAGQGQDLGVLLVPQRQRFEDLLDIGRIFRLAEQAAAEADRGPHRLERIGVQFLRHQPDHRARRTVIRRRYHGRQP